MTVVFSDAGLPIAPSMCWRCSRRRLLRTPGRAKRSRESGSSRAAGSGRRTCVRLPWRHSQPHAMRPIHQPPQPPEPQASLRQRRTPKRWRRLTMRSMPSGLACMRHWRGRLRRPMPRGRAMGNSDGRSPTPRRPFERSCAAGLRAILVARGWTPSSTNSTRAFAAEEEGAMRQRHCWLNRPAPVSASAPRWRPGRARWIRPRTRR